MLLLVLLLLLLLLLVVVVDFFVLVDDFFVVVLFFSSLDVVGVKTGVTVSVLTVLLVTVELSSVVSAATVVSVVT